MKVKMNVPLPPPPPPPTIPIKTTWTALDGGGHVTQDYFLILPLHLVVAKPLEKCPEHNKIKVTLRKRLKHVLPHKEHVSDVSFVEQLNADSCLFFTQSIYFDG